MWVQPRAAALGMHPGHAGSCVQLHRLLCSMALSSMCSVVLLSWKDEFSHALAAAPSALLLALAPCMPWPHVQEGPQTIEPRHEPRAHALVQSCHK